MKQYVAKDTGISMNSIRDPKIWKVILKINVISLPLGLIAAHFMNPYIAVIISVCSCLIIMLKYLKQRGKDIAELTHYIREINDNNFDYDFKSYKEGELSILHTELNKITVTLKMMNKNLEASNEFLKKSLADISHQLKTPITSLMLTNEIILEETHHSPFAIQNQNQLFRLNTLVTSLLKFIKLESNTFLMDKKTVQCDAFLNTLIRLVEPQLHSIKIEIQLNAVSFEIDEVWFTEAIYNILNNKMRYAKSRINIEIENTYFNTRIRIKDDGVKIEKRLREKLFERFYKSSNDDPTGLGIGLAMTKEIIQKHQGTIRVVDDNTFEILLPLSDI